MAHYFTNDNSEKRIYERAYAIDGNEFRFVTSDGVFSKGGIDEGTDWLIKAVLPFIADDAGLADLGCGYGAAGIVIAALKPLSRCYMFDINEKAVELANLNAHKNGVSGRAAAIVCDGLAGLAGLAAPVGVVVTNPPFRAGKQVVTRFFTESHNALSAGGTFFAVLRKQQGAESYIKTLKEIYGNCDIILKKKGYVVVRAACLAHRKAPGQFDDRVRF
ncbi:MAG: methyltransferase [Defluviitaleaceae bacterium]|nr:methyltransferase [Defluviitaleaceae bacterium]